MKIATVGLDLAKNIFQVYGVDEHGKKVVSKSLKRPRVQPYFANLPSRPVGREASESLGTRMYRVIPTFNLV